MFRILSIPTALALALALTGCVSSLPTPVRRSSGAIIEVNLLTMPVALNLNAAPGADGIQVRVFLVAQGQAKTVPMASGTLEVVAYDGSVSPEHLPAPFQVWRFGPDALIPSAFNSMVGTGYNLILSWAPRILTRKRVTVLAKYRPPHGPAVVSAPSFIAATSQ
jgi:hypothetical protein